MGLFSKKTSTKETFDTRQSGSTTPTLPGWLTAGTEALSNNILGLRNNDPASFVAGPSQLQQQQFGIAGEVGGQAGGLLGSAGRMAQQAGANAQTLGGFMPQQVRQQYITETPQADLRQAFGSLGSIDPSGAFGNLLSGDVRNSYLSDQLAANSDAARSSFGSLLDDTADTLTRQVMPTIRSGAMASGGYGGSRQGIAEGLALGDANKALTRSAQGLAASLAQTNANTLSGAFENAQNRQLSAAQGLAGLAAQTAAQNADRRLNTSMFNVTNDTESNKFNSMLGLQRNAQALDANSQALQSAGLMGDLSRSGLDFLAGSGEQQQQLDQAQAGAPIDVLGRLTDMFGSLPLALFRGEETTQSASGTATSKSKQSGATLSDWLNYFASNAQAAARMSTGGGGG